MPTGYFLSWMAGHRERNMHNLYWPIHITDTYLTIIKNHMHRIILSKREALLLGPQTWGRSLSMRTHRRVKKTVQKTGPRPIFSYLKNPHKDWWKVDANDPRRGGGITELAHIKLLRALTSEGPDLQKKARLLWLPALYTLNRELHSLGHRLKVTLASLKRFVKETAVDE